MSGVIVPADGFTPRLRQSWTVTWPLLVGSLSSLALAVADTAILGQYDTQALAAMTIAAPLVLVTTAIISPLGSATQILTAQAAGADDREQAAVLLRNALRFGGALGLGAAALIALTSPWLLAALGGELADDSGARPVLLLLLPTIPLGVITAIGRGSLVGLGDTRASMRLALTVNIANIVLDLVLVFGADLGAVGSALGTSLASGLGVVIMSWLVRRQQLPTPGEGAERSDEIEMSRLRRVAWPDMTFGAVSYGADALVVAAVSRLDTVSLTAYRIIGTTIAIVFVVAYTASTALSMLVGQRLGADDPAGARAWTAPMAVLAVIGTLIVGGPALLAPDVWFSLLSGDESVVRAAADQRWLWTVLLPAMSVGMVLAGIIRATGDTRSMMWIGVGAQGLFAMPLAWFLGVHLDWGLQGVVIAVASGWVLRALLSAARARFGSTWVIIPQLTAPTSRSR